MDFFPASLLGREFLKTKQSNNFRKAIKKIGPKEVRSLFNNGNSARTPYFSVKYLKNDKEYNRFVIIVPKKTGTAAERNKIKRKTREYVRVFCKKASYPIDILIIVHPSEMVIKEMSGLEKALSLWFEPLKKQLQE